MTESPPSGAAASSRILIVEDEPALLRLLVRMLATSGHELLQAADGPEALQRFAECGGDVVLLVTDLVLPGMRGDELAARLRAQSPTLAVLFVSGHALPGANAPALSGTGAVAALGKPFGASELRRAVRALLPHDADDADEDDTT